MLEMDNSLPLVILTIVMSVPLLLSYNIRYVIFPEGLPFAILYAWGLVSVFVVPILFLTEVILVWRLARSSETSDRKSKLKYSFAAMSVAFISLVVFLVVRALPC